MVSLGPAAGLCPDTSGQEHCLGTGAVCSHLRAPEEARPVQPHRPRGRLPGWATRGRCRPSAAGAAGLRAVRLGSSRSKGLFPSASGSARQLSSRALQGWPPPPLLASVPGCTLILGEQPRVCTTRLGLLLYSWKEGAAPGSRGEQASTRKARGPEGSTWHTEAQGQSVRETAADPYAPLPCTQNASVGTGLGCESGPRSRFCSSATRLKQGA